MNILLNYLYNLSYQLLVIVLPIITTPYISRVLQVDGVGQYSVSAAIVNYFVLFGMLGISTYGNRQIAYVRDDEEEMSKTFWEINILKISTMSVSIVVYIIFVFLRVDHNARTLYLLQIFTLLASLIDISWFFHGIEAFKKTATRNIVVKIISVICIFAFVKVKSDIWKYALIISLSTFIGQCLLWKDIPKLILKIRPDLKKLKVHLTRTLLLWAPALAIQVYSSLDKVMLGYLTNNVEVGLYENSQKLVKIAATVTTALSTVTLPRISNYYKNNNLNGFKMIVDQSFRMTSFVSVPLAFGILAIRESIVPWFFGPGYERISELLVISAWLIITLSWSSIFGAQILVGCNHEKQYTISVTVGAGINVLLNSILIRTYGSAGAIVASVAAEYSGMLLMLFFVKKMIDVGSLFRCIPKYILASLIMYIPTFALGRYFEGNITTTLIQIIVGVMIYISSMTIVKDKSMMQIWAKIRGLTLRWTRK